MDRIDERALLSRNIHVPRECEECGKTDMKYMGIGEYKCEDCGHIMYDDFGIVRNYLEVHKGATQSEVSKATGVAMETIRQFLKEERLEITAGSGVFMACEICKAPIRSGRYCEACAKKVDEMRRSEAANAHMKKNSMHGFGMTRAGESGAKRYTR